MGSVFKGPGRGSRRSRQRQSKAEHKRAAAAEEKAKRDTLVSRDDRHGLLLNCIRPFMLLRRDSADEPLHYVEGEWTKFSWTDRGNIISGIATCRVPKDDRMRMLILRIGNGEIIQALPFAKTDAEDKPGYVDLKMLLDLPACLDMSDAILIRSQQINKKPQKPCRMCGEPTWLKCSRCDLVSYCGDKCQESGRQYHIKMCRLIGSV